MNSILIKSTAIMLFALPTMALAGDGKAIISQIGTNVKAGVEFINSDYDTVTIYQDNSQSSGLGSEVKLLIEAPYGLGYGTNNVSLSQIDSGAGDNKIFMTLKSSSSNLIDIEQLGQNQHAGDESNPMSIIASYGNSVVIDQIAPGNEESKIDLDIIRSSENDITLMAINGSDAATMDIDLADGFNNTVLVNMDGAVNATAIVDIAGSDATVTANMSCSDCSSSYIQQ